MTRRRRVAVHEAAAKITARLRALLLRRRLAAADATLCVADLQIDPRARSARRGERQLALMYLC